MIKEQEILKLLKDQWTNKDIIKTLKNVTNWDIYLCCKKYNINRKKSARNRELLRTEIETLVKQGYTNKEVAEQLHISLTTARKYTKLSNLDTNSCKHHRIKEVILTNEQLEVIYGSLLGDMCMCRTEKLARFSINQGGNQEAYFDHKCAIFPNLLGKISKVPRYDKRTNKYYNKYMVRSLAHQTYKDIYDLCYPNGVKTLSKEWLDKLTSRSLAYWFMDDGSDQGTIATNSFSYSEMELLVNIMIQKFNIKCVIKKVHNKEQYVLHILKEERWKFYELVKPYIIPSMQYKFISKSWNLKPRELLETREDCVTTT